MNESCKGCEYMRVHHYIEEAAHNRYLWLGNRDEVRKTHKILGFTFTTTKFVYSDLTRRVFICHGMPTPYHKTSQNVRNPWVWPRGCSLKKVPDGE